MSIYMFRFASIPVRIVQTLALLVTVLAAGPARAQCEDLAPGPFAAPSDGAMGYVHAMIQWGTAPDGVPQMVAGGDFDQIGGIACNGVAKWDGQAWRSIGEGILGTVNALTVWNGNLVAGGYFANAAGGQISSVLVWNGSQWVPLGPISGLGSLTGEVHALAVYNGELIAGGDDNLPGSIVRWNGTAWQALGLGVDNSVYALTVFGGSLYAGGRFETANGIAAPNIARWDGTWHAVGGGVGCDGSFAIVRAMHVFGGALIVAGSFCGADDGAVDSRNCVRWTGSAWQAMDSNINDDISALATYNGSLIAGGAFTPTTGFTPTRVARWTGTSWANLSTGVGTLVDTSWQRVESLAAVNGMLYAGGGFLFVGGAPARGIAQWNNAIWSGMSPPVYVLAMAPLGGRLAVAGAFVQESFGSPTAPAYNIAAWDGATMAPLGSGVNGTVRALTSFVGVPPLNTNVLVAGGDFTVAGGIAANRVASFTESIFVGGGWAAMGSGFNNTVYALERFNSRTVAAGTFTASGATAVNRIARWTDIPSGSPFAWHPMGTGFNDTVRALKSYSLPSPPQGNIQIVAAGDFTTAGGVAANRIASWTESTIVITTPVWAPMGNGFNSTVACVERHAGSTYAGGAFTMSGSTVVNGIARFNTALNPDAWVPVGNGIGFNGVVNALESKGAYLYATGSFTSVDGIAANRIARWDGVNWQAVDDGEDNGVNGSGNALAAFHGDEMWIGGTFSALQTTYASHGLAAYRETGLPWIPGSGQPDPQASTQCNGNVDLQVTPAWAFDVQYQWRKDGVNLIDGPTGDGSVIFGAQGQMMQIQLANSADAGTYDCVVFNACGSVTSASVTVSVLGCCPADINGDGSVSVTDLLSVINGWGSCAAPCPPRCAADIAPAPDGDCGVNVSDLLAVINGWGACVAPTGACCINAACQTLTAAGCASSGGFYHGNGSLCGVVECNPDFCIAAIDITSAINVADVFGDNSLATPVEDAGGDPELPFGSPTCHWSNDPELIHNTVWYKFTAPPNGMVTISLCASVLDPGFFSDSTMALYSGECSSLVQVACDEDGCGAEPARYLSRIVAGGLTPGQTYRLCVMNAGGSTASIPGQFTLTITSPP